MGTSVIEESVEGVIITIRVVPRASKTEIIGKMDGAVKVRVASPPVDGAANAEIVKLFARSFCVPRSSVTILSGQHSKTKRIRIIGATAESVLAVLG